jgi:hypothetical protein
LECAREEASLKSPIEVVLADLEVMMVKTGCMQSQQAA